MKWTPIEVDLWGALERLASAPAAGAAKRFLVPPQGCDTDSALVDLLLREAASYHALERDIAACRLAGLRTHAAALIEGKEHDRTGAPSPITKAGYDEALERIASCERALSDHDRALARLAHPTAAESVRVLLSRFERRKRADLDALRARAGDGEVVELCADGYALAPTRAQQLSARRELLGLPQDRDWS